MLSVMKNTPTDPVPLLQELIRCKSVTPSEGGALTLLENRLSQAGFVCQRLIFKDTDTPDVENLFARFGTGAPHLCFAGHTDVVPEGHVDAWSHAPFAADIADGFVYGRGATDMKGSVAAFTAAAIDFVRTAGKFKGSISFLITGDEEGPAINGTVKVLQWMRDNGHVPDHCLVGEPSCVDRLGDTIKIGRRGSLSFTVVVEGRQGHSAYPHKADNPVPKLARFVDRISHAKLDEGNDAFRSLDARRHQLRRRQCRDQRHSVQGDGEVQHPLLDGACFSVAARLGECPCRCRPVGTGRHLVGGQQ